MVLEATSGGGSGEAADLLSLDYEGDRIFVRISVIGCGSGCAYCFISAPGSPPRYATFERIDRTCDQLHAMKVASGNGFNRVILALSPETEPFKCAASTERVGRILQQVLPWGNPVQISTKEVVPPAIWELTATSPNVVIFSSFTSFTLAHRLEPHAAPPSDRLSNFSSGRWPTGAASCALIKPFIAQTARDIEHFRRAFAHSRPTAVCVGMAYRSPTKGPAAEARTYVHPVANAWHSEGIPPALVDFADDLGHHLEIPIFRTSRCVHSWLRDTPPGSPIWNDESLCIRCRRCPDLGAGADPVPTHPVALTRHPAPVTITRRLR